MDTMTVAAEQLRGVPLLKRVSAQEVAQRLNAAGGNDNASEAPAISPVAVAAGSPPARLTSPMAGATSFATTGTPLSMRSLPSGRSDMEPMSAMTGNGGYESVPKDDGFSDRGRARTEATVNLRPAQHGVPTPSAGPGWI